MTEYIGKEYTPDEHLFQEMLAAQKNLDADELNEYLCEVCDTKETLTEEQAYSAGWDYPPFIGLWGILSPRTCPNCTVEGTAYWAVITGAPLTEKHEATIRRVLEERIVVPE